MINHIPGSQPTPRTMSQANRQHEARRTIEQVKSAQCPPLHTRTRTPRVGLWAVVVAVFLLGAFAGFASLIGPGKAVIVTAVCAAVIGMTIASMAARREQDEDRVLCEMMSEAERPHVNP